MHRRAGGVHQQLPAIDAGAAVAAVGRCLLCGLRCSKATFSQSVDGANAATGVAIVQAEPDLVWSFRRADSVLLDNFQATARSTDTFVFAAPVTVLSCQRALADFATFPAIAALACTG